MYLGVPFFRVLFRLVCAKDICGLHTYKCLDGLWRLRSGGPGVGMMIVGCGIFLGLYPWDW